MFLLCADIERRRRKLHLIFFQTNQNENRLFGNGWIVLLLFFFSHWHSINLTIERIRHSRSHFFSLSLSSRSDLFFIDIYPCKFNIHICMASTQLNQFLFLRSFLLRSFFLLLLLFPFLSLSLVLSIWDAYKWSAKLPRELLLLVHVFRRMGKKDSLAYSFVRSFVVGTRLHTRVS